MDLELDDKISLLKTIYPFNLLAQDSMQSVALHFEEMSWMKGNVIYQRGDTTDYLYLIVSGQILISFDKNNDHQNTTIKSEGSLFGEEALYRSEVRETWAVCESDVRLLRIDASHLTQIKAQNQLIDKAFILIYQTFRLSLKLDLSWRNHNETIKLISRRHPFFLLLRVLLVGGAGLTGFILLLFFAFSVQGVSILLLTLSILSLVFGGLFAAWSAMEWSNDYFFITDERVLVHKQLIGFFESRQESPLSAILSIGLNTSIWGRSIGFGTLTMRSYTGDLKFERLPSPHLIYELLENQRQKMLENSKREEQLGMRDALRQRLVSGSQPKSQSPRKEPSTLPNSIYQGSSLLELLARFFGLRTVKDGSIIYRTHWWILVKKTFSPFMLMILILILVLARLTGLLESIPEVFLYAVAIIGVILAWGWWLYQYLDWHNDIYIIAPDQLVDVSRKPLGSEDKRSAPVKNIQTVEFLRKGLIGLILNYGTVRIQIGNEELTFDNVYNPSAIQVQIFSHFTSITENNKKNEQQRMADWIETYDEIKRENTQNSKFESDAERG